MEFDWEFVGTALLEGDPRPIVVLDLSLRALRANPAFHALAMEEVAELHLSKFDDWLLAGTRPLFLDAWRRAVGGERLRVSAAAFHLELAFELVPLTHAGAVHSVLVVVVATTSVPVPIVPPLGVLYEVSLDRAGRPVRLLRALAADVLQVDTTRPCYRALHRREGPCEWCPLKNMSKDGTNTVVHLESHSPFKASLLTARTGRDVATVRATPVDERIHSQLVHSRIEALSLKAKLTERERQVLALVLNGRTLSAIAAARGFNVRTAKYHHQNMLRKLGAESRADLFRLLS